MQDATKTAGLLKKQAPFRPALAMILGSGFQQALNNFKVSHEIGYGLLPGFPPVGVSGHAGKMIFGHFDKVPAVVLKGRAHYYEGHDMSRVTFPVRVLAEFGVKSLLLTNAGGGVNRKYRPGDFMILDDHINLMGTNPLRGPAVAGLPRFVDLTECYDRQLTDMAKKAAKASKVRWHCGVYLAVSGPNYETPAEITAFRRLGADSVGMSTVPEAIVARQCGMSVAAVSFISNLAASRDAGKLSHHDVLAMGEQKKDEPGKFLEAFAKLYGEMKVK
jgi:purine-nucleoside phosphorylase